MATPRTTESEPPPATPLPDQVRRRPNGREHDACFSSMSVPEHRLLGGSPRGLVHGLMTTSIPWSQGKCREFRRIGLLLRRSVSKTSANPAIYGRIPYADEQ